MNGAIPVVQWEEANFPIAIKETGADGSRKFGLILSMFNRSNGKKLKNKMEARQRHFDRVRFGRRLSGMQPMPAGRRAEAAFTMIEIAIAIGVIGFALVAVIGILPRGMVAQKDNREDTLIMQDAPYFMNAIRNGEMRTNNNILMNYVETIAISNQTGWFTNFNATLVPGAPNSNLNTDMAIIGLLSTPELTPTNIGYSNVVVATIRAMSGSSMQQNGANSATAFRYQLSVEIDPWNFNNSANYNNPGGAYAPAYTSNQLSYLSSSLHDLRMRFAWPVIVGANGYTIQSLGPNRQTYRTQVNSQLIMTNTVNTSLWFFQPGTFSNNTNT